MSEKQINSIYYNEKTLVQNRRNWILSLIRTSWQGSNNYSIIELKPQVASGNAISIEKINDKYNRIMGRKQSCVFSQ